MTTDCAYRGIVTKSEQLQWRWGRRGGRGERSIKLEVTVQKTKERYEIVDGEVIMPAAPLVVPKHFPSTDHCGHSFERTEAVYG